MKTTHMNYPKYFEIQTTSYCNGGCLICPYREVSGSLPAGVMKQELFEKIIDQIGQRNSWGTRVIPYFNNEPFLDKSFIERIKYINEKCPAAEVEISTNLSLLDLKKQQELSACLIKELRISVFGFTKPSYEKIMSGLKWEKMKKNLDLLCANKSLRSRIGQISLVIVNYPGVSAKEVSLARNYCRDHFIKFEFWGFLDRAGNVSTYSNNIIKRRVHGCEQSRTSERLHVLFDGRVVMCCMDWKQEYILGNLAQQTIEEVWNSKKYHNLRKMFGEKKTDAPALCKKCKLSL